MLSLLIPNVIASVGLLNFGIHITTALAIN